MLPHREEIDGLRAIALLPVVLYHAGFILLLPGGYVGVDIFFVISGYLITSLIDAEMREGTFSLIHFYERRCRRILPALYVILFISCYFAYHCMSSGQLKEFGYSLISVVTFSSNIFFWWKDDRYFSRFTEFNPLVHTWSLAVEEQFYLVFPLLCYVLFKKRRHLILLLGFVALLSFGLAQWGGNNRSTFYMFLQHPWASFYMPIGRAWELLLGSFVAFYLKTHDPATARKSSSAWKQLFALLGLLLIIVSILLFDSRLIPPFPNCYTLVPTVGAALIIIFANPENFVGRLLSTRPLRWVGLVSYSAYLCHQPLLVYLRLRSTESREVSYVLFITVVILLLATLSYFFVEQPFRNRTLLSRKHIFSISGIGTLLLLLAAVFIIRTADHRSITTNKAVNHTFSPVNKTVNNRSLIAIEEFDTYLYDIEPIELSNYVTRRFDTLMRTYPTFSNQSASTNRRILLIGDSFAQDFLNMATETGRLRNYEIRCHYVRIYCQIYMGTEDRMKWITPEHRQLCINENDIRLGLPLIRQANIIILAACWFEWSAIRLPKTIESLNLTHSQKLFVMGVKNFGKVNLHLYMNKPFEYRVQQRQQSESDFVKVNTIMKQTLPRSSFVDVLNITCTYANSTCPVFTPRGKLISYDGWHTTKHGARYVGDLIFQSFPLNQL